MQVVIGGASGFLGTALVAHLRERGHHVTRLIRSGTPADDASLWDPQDGRIDQIVIDRADAVVNLAGSPITQWPRTKGRSAEILQSRVAATTTLADAVASSPRPPVFICGSGMSWYGVDRGDEVLTEESGPGDGFLAEVTHAWEEAAAPAADAGARVCFARTSLVLDDAGGILRLMLLPFRLGGGARLGSGRQYMSYISRQDWVRAVGFMLETPEASGPFNLATTLPVTNTEFTAELGRILHRPTLLTVPSFALKIALGGIAEDLLGSLRLSPAALTELGFAFAEPDLRSTLEAALR